MYINALDYQIINSSDFHPSSSPLWERQHNPCLYARVPAGNHAGTTVRNIMQGWQKEKGDQYPPTSSPQTPQAFGKQKAIAH